MTYENLYEVLSFLKENNVEMTDKIENIIDKSKISKNEYEILLYDSEIIELYYGIPLFYREQVRKFLVNVREQAMSIQELKECMILIAKTSTIAQQEQVRLACEVKEIRNDKEFLRILIIQKDAEIQQNLINKYLEALETRKNQNNENKIVEEIKKQLQEQEKQIQEAKKQRQEREKQRQEQIAELDKMLEAKDLDGFLDYYSSVDKKVKQKEFVCKK